MPGRRARHGMLTALVATAAALPGPLIAAPAHAAPGCSSALAPVGPVEGPAWAQQRYAPDRLAPLATGAGITVAVIDSGVDDDHPQLVGRITDGADYLDPGQDGRLDCSGHGTAVASIIAAVPRRGATLRGLAPGAEILPVRVSEQQIIDGKESGRTVSPAQFAQAIRWAVDHDADVLNLSVVLYEDNPAVRNAIGYAVGHDVVVVAAAGNLHEQGDPTPYPAAYDGVLAVGSIGATGFHSAFSQVGPYVDIVAPGEKVLTARPDRGHQEQNGTSYAAPFVAATAALVRDYWPDLTAAQVIDRIIATADPAPSGGRSDAYGNGVLNPYRAVTDTSAPQRVAPASALPVQRVDPAVVAEQGRRDQARQRALWLAGFAGTAAALALLLTAVLRQGARRRWRPADPN